MGVGSNNHLEKWPGICVCKALRYINPCLCKHWAGQLPFRNAWYIWHLQVSICKFKSFQFPVIFPPFTFHPYMGRMSRLGQAVAFYFVWTPGLFVCKIFTSTTYWVRIKVPLLCILFVQGFVIGERELLTFTCMEHSPIKMKVFHNAGGGVSLWCWPLTPHTMWYSVSCSLKWKPSEPSTKIFHQE